MTILQPIGVDGGTETWRAHPDPRWPMCGCTYPQFGETRHDRMVCRVCGLPNLAALLNLPD